MLLLLSEKTSKPTSGDICFGNKTIEIKTNGGKLGLGVGRDANKIVVEFCKAQGISLRVSKKGKEAREKEIFNPTRAEDRLLIGEYGADKLEAVLQVWWKAISGETIDHPTWEVVRKSFLVAVATQQLKNADQLLVIDSDGDYKIFKTSEDVVGYYDNDSSTFEYRGHQGNPFSIYLTLPSVAKKVIEVVV